MHWDGYWPMGWWMWIGWLVVLIIVIVVLRVATASGRRDEGPGPETPEQVVKRRYAAGEIDRETYERMLEDLRK